jgi:hypothetical protein
MLSVSIKNFHGDQSIYLKFAKSQCMNYIDIYRLGLGLRIEWLKFSK